MFGLLALDELIAARYQMAVSLGFHIVLSCFGVAFPTMIYVVHRRGLYNDDEVALTLARKWSKVAAVLFAVGAVSGTILSFEMGLLWPGMMETFGDVIGIPFALEGIAFFVEAVFIGIYLFGWDRLPPKVHLRTLIPIIASGLFGTFCILAVNSWMNAPSGFRLTRDASGTLRATDVDPLAAIFNRALWPQFIHMFVATYLVTGFLAAAVYAVGILRGRRDHAHRLGFVVPFAFATVAALVQPVIGHVAGMRLATDQPSKLAAMELAVETETNAPFTVGGVLIDGEMRGGIEIPGLGSLLTRASTDRAVPGLEEFPAEDRPPANIVHLSFQTMIASGFAMIGIAVWFWWKRRRSDPFESRWLMRAAVAAGVLSVVALEAGWITTEVGRQPWIVYGVMRVEDAVTENSGIWISFGAIVVIYTAMAVAAAMVLRSMARRWRDTDDVDLPTPYGPPAPEHPAGSSMTAVGS
jgi:cytochrome bd ubiquinol oxidase subunit I